ncbi:MAG: peroxidase [Deltaproteobacteria bacterium]|nr:peroxidase [Deltaproteobacteria bacterium]MDQ3295975.1 peroxidase [Myxococcota bacterium]
METLAKPEIQGLIVRGYGRLPSAQFLLLEVRDAVLARGYLQRLCERGDGISVTTANVSPDDVALHVAFTAPGLVQLGVPASAVESFARELVEGMDEPTRAMSLGDQGVNDPEHWTWGREKPHVLLLIYAKDELMLAERVDRERTALEASGFHVIVAKHTAPLRADQKEHFGWKDGLSTPIMEGSERAADPHEVWTFPFRAGEFVLGYRNEYEAYSESPTVALDDDPQGHLPLTSDGTAKDLGRNGTYLVYREMTQDVPGFWKYLATNSREPGDDEVTRAIALGSKMVGRWPGGAPLVASPSHDDPALSNINDFTYHDEDQHHRSTACPFGAHIRRANPRDQLPSEHDRDDSIEMVRKHQMIRRGRVFGPPLADSMDPRDFLAKRDEPDLGVRGLHFICLVGHIGRQFEFVQRAWINSPNFAAMFRDADPIIGVHRPPPDPNVSDEFTCPAEPLRRKYKGMPQFTRLVGGAYFFLPGMRALRFIARHPLPL